ncbi:hypothetical protein CDO81_26925 [Roseateles puraquae]|uniref:Uncharacterized protein n=2 Tax=Roseateles puraquae TaxID=431059 RepID=A0A254N6A2_9BURK|nr:hypothetical protein CDO81_26925 [Roseateles puraquae]
MGMGGALKGAVQAVVNGGAAGLSVADAGSQAAFQDAWSRTLTAHARHLRAKGKELEAPVVLVHADDCTEVGKGLGWTKRPMLGGSHTDPYAGTLAVGTAEISAYVKPDYVQDTNAMTDALRAAGLGNAFTVALLSTSSLVIWPRGVDCEETPEIQRDLSDAPVTIDLAALDLLLERFYESNGRQPRGWWKDRANRIVIEGAEGVVQDDLWTFMMGKYSDVARIKAEMWIGYGRADITFVPHDPVHTSAVFELKVTKDFSTPIDPAKTTPGKITLKENIDWAVSGVPQAAAYRDDENLKVGFLCVYDFCDGDKAEITKAIETEAAPHGVYARRYWVTSSNKQHRVNRYGKPPGT